MAKVIPKLLEAAAKTIGSELEHVPDEDCYGVTLDFDGRAQSVWLYTVEEYFTDGEQMEDVLFIETRVGAFSDAVDPVALLRKNEDLIMAKILLLGNEERTIVVRSAIPVSAANPEVLGAMIVETAGWADELEQELFNTDES